MKLHSQTPVQGCLAAVALSTAPHFTVLLLAVVLWAAPVLVFMSTAAHAEDDVPTMSPRIYHRLAHLQPDLEAGRYKDIHEQLQNLLPTTDNGNRYDRAVLLQLLGQMQLRLEEVETAITSFEAADTLNILPQQDADDLKEELARLYVSKGRYTDAISKLETVSKQDRNRLLLLAQSYLQLERYRDALQPLQQLIDNDPTPEIKLYEALFFAQHAVGEVDAAIHTMQTLIELAPNTTVYWRQLAALHHEHGRSNHALAVLEAAYQNGTLQSSIDDVLNLVGLYHSEGAPHKAAAILQQLLAEQPLQNNIALHEQLVELWLDARHAENAGNTLKQLIEHSPAAERWLRLGQLHIEQRNWAAAAQAIHTAIQANTKTDNSKTDNNKTHKTLSDKPLPNKPLSEKPLSDKQLAEAWLWLGIVEFERGRTAAARAAFMHSENHVATQDAAQPWLRYLETLP